MRHNNTFTNLLYLYLLTTRPYISQEHFFAIFTSAFVQRSIEKERFRHMELV